METKSIELQDNVTEPEAAATVHNVLAGLDALNASISGDVGVG